MNSLQLSIPVRVNQWLHAVFKVNISKRTNTTQQQGQHTGNRKGTALSIEGTNLIKYRAKLNKRIQYIRVKMFGQGPSIALCYYPESLLVA